MPGRARLLIITGLLSVGALSAGTAQAYVRSVADDGQHQLYWSTGCETVIIYLNGFSAMTADEVAKSIGAAAAAWGPDDVTCPADVGDAGDGHPSFEILPQLSTGGPAPRLVDDSGNPITDGNNSIVFETANYDGPYGSLAYAQVSKEPDGRIVEADIAINATSPDILWANLDPGAPPAKNGQLRFDLQTVMTHEFGHLLGLAHTCVGSDSTVGGDGDSPPSGSKDNLGQTIPVCTDPPDPTNATQAEAVMWYVIAQESFSNRVLKADDARGVCAIYPPTLNPPACTQNLPDDGCGCATGGSPVNRLMAVAVAGLALVARRRRRTRRH
jgi:MYXO-CTERM domain-containing protein